MSAKQSVQLAKPHTHAGKLYAAGDTIPAAVLTDADVAWLVRRKIGTTSTTTTAPKAKE